MFYQARRSMRVGVPATKHPSHTVAMVGISRYRMNAIRVSRNPSARFGGERRTNKAAGDYFSTVTFSSNSLMPRSVGSVQRCLIDRTSGSNPSIRGSSLRLLSNHTPDASACRSRREAPSEAGSPSCGCVVIELASWSQRAFVASETVQPTEPPPGSQIALESASTASPAKLNTPVTFAC